MKTFDTLSFMTKDDPSSEHATQKAIPTAQRIYRFIVQSICSGELTPTIREIQQALHIAWIGDVHYHLTRLEARGLLTRQARCMRGLRVPLLSPVAAEGDPGVALVPLELIYETSCGLQLCVCTNNYQAAHILAGDHLLVKPAPLQDGMLLLVLYDPCASGSPCLTLACVKKGAHGSFYFLPLEQDFPHDDLAPDTWSRDWVIIGSVFSVVRRIVP